MGRETIGSVTEWEPGWETDMAYNMAMTFLAAALGDPPQGVTIDIVLEDNDLGDTPAIAVCWPELDDKPWGFIRRAASALATFDDAVDWSRIHPSRFPSPTEDDEDDLPRIVFTPGSYLDHLAETFCASLQGADEGYKSMWRDDLQHRARDMDLDWSVTPKDSSFESLVRAILSPSNYAAMEWASKCVALGRAGPADPDDPSTILDRLYWPTEPGCRVRKD